MLSSVDLPQPEAPTRHKNSPNSTSRETLSTACTASAPAPYTLDTDVKETAEPDPMWRSGSVVSRARGRRLMRC